MGTMWRGLLCPINATAGDNRRFMTGGGSSRPLPLALKWQREDEPGHDSSVVVGIINTITEEADGMWGEGEFFDDIDPEALPRLAEDAREAVLLVQRKAIGCSVDLGACDVVEVAAGTDVPLTPDEMDDLYMEAWDTGKSPDIEVLYTSYEIASATLVPIPAFAECRPFELTEALTASVRKSWSDFGFAPRDMEWDGSAADKRISEDAGIGGDNPDWGRFAAAHLYVDENADPETKGAYKFLILDVVDGERVIVPRAVFTTAGVLNGSMGGTNIPQTDQDEMKDVVAGLYERMATEFEDDGIVAPFACGGAKKKKMQKAASIIADNKPATYDLALFAPPVQATDGLLSITVTADGRVFGHIATHDVCHVGIPGVCMQAPVDLAEFDAFHRYPLVANDGEVFSVGRLTYGAGQLFRSCECPECRGNDDHACSKLSMGGAIAHHDKMETVAYVRAWEDKTNNGILVAGIVAPGASKQGVKALSRGRVSGDWRSIGGELRLVEVLTLHRERPGFPLPRGRMADGQLASLVAAGTVGSVGMGEPPVGDGIDYERLSTLITSKLIESGAFATAVAEPDVDQVEVGSGDADIPVVDLDLVDAGDVVVSMPDTGDDHTMIAGELIANIDTIMIGQEAARLIREIGEA